MNPRPVVDNIHWGGSVPAPQLKAAPAHLSRIAAPVPAPYPDEFLLGQDLPTVRRDAAVPYRTTLYLADALAGAYDSDAVCAALQADFEAHGPPLVLRMDRASARQTPDVGALLDRWGVLVLHGPPHHPRFYGQLERQNQEHRAWLRDVHAELLARDELVHALEQLRHALNDVWPRPSLGYLTAAEVFRAPPELRVDRRELREEVHSLAQGRIARDHLEGYEAGLPLRHRTDPPTERCHPDRERGMVLTNR